MSSEVECPREQEAARAGRGEPMSGEMRAHLASCPSCPGVARTAGLLTRLALVDAAAPLPSSTQLWWKAQILRRMNARTSAERPLAGAEWVQAALGVAAAALLLVWQLPVAARVVANIGASSSVAAPLALAGAPVRPLFVLACAAVVTTIVLAVGLSRGSYSVDRR